MTLEPSLICHALSPIRSPVESVFLFLFTLPGLLEQLRPASPEKVQERLKALKSYALLEGARGGMAVDTGAFAALVSRVSTLVAAHPEIVELDLNPVRIFRDGRAMALDVRARIVR
jgi:hypothetical protein